MIFGIYCPTKKKYLSTLKELDKLGYLWWRSDKSLLDPKEEVYSDEKGNTRICFNTKERTVGYGSAKIPLEIVIKQWRNMTIIEKLEEAEPMEQLTKLKQ